MLKWSRPKTVIINGVKHKRITSGLYEITYGLDVKDIEELKDKMNKHALLNSISK